MPKRLRLLNSMKNKTKVSGGKEHDDSKDKEVSTARGRLKGALLDVLGDESDSSSEFTAVKRERKLSREYYKECSSEDDEKPQRKPSPVRQSYVLKLFDRSVDLSQFSEDSPLYPICRAWIANQPKAKYSEMGKTKNKPEPAEDGVELPGPQGPPISRIPDLTPEQKASSKDNINLNYRESSLPTRDELLNEHSVRWNTVRMAWLDQAVKVEARYAESQRILYKINVNPI